jgi:histidinol-phosphate aminotransferase
MSRKKTVYDDLTHAVVGAALAVYREVGPGFAEKAYQRALMIELKRQSIPAQEEVIFEVGYQGQPVGEFRIDILVDDAVVVELKALNALNDACQRQVISYLAASGRDVGVLLNFGAASLEHKRIFPPRSVKNSQAFQEKHDRWYPAWQKRHSQRAKESAPPYQTSAKSFDFIRRDIAALEPYKPNIYYEDLAARLGCAPEDLLKLDANENAFGPPTEVRNALAELRFPHFYPDLENGRLRRALSACTGVDADQLLVGAGSDELLELTFDLLIEPGDAVINLPPTFSMYAFNGVLAGARLIDIPRHADFSLDVDAIEAAVLQERPKLLIVCSPNNPTANLVPDAELERLLALPVIVLLDEAYVEFSDAESRITEVPERENLIVLRTFSKMGGLAGLRVGYGAFPQALIPHLWKIKEPFTVSVPATVAALAALESQEVLDRSRDQIVSERERLRSALQTLPYLTPYPSQTNFVLCHVHGRDRQVLRTALEEEGILLRYYDKPSLEGMIRITVGRPEHTDRLMRTLRRL